MGMKWVWKEKQLTDCIYWFFGATVRNRTADILITSEVLYHLSYGGLANID